MFDKMKILIGIDGSEHSKNALMEAINIAKRFSGSVKVISVHKRGMVNQAERLLKEAETYLKLEKIENEVLPILGSNPARALIFMAEHEKFDLIVVGSRGLGSAASMLLGSVSKKVVANAPCDVLVVKK